MCTVAQMRCMRWHLHARREAAHCAARALVCTITPLSACAASDVGSLCTPCPTWCLLCKSTCRSTMGPDGLNACAAETIDRMRRMSVPSPNVHVCVAVDLDVMPRMNASHHAPHTTDESSERRRRSKWRLGETAVYGGTFDSFGCRYQQIPRVGKLPTLKFLWLVPCVRDWLPVAISSVAGAAQPESSPALHSFPASIRRLIRTTTGFTDHNRASWAQTTVATTQTAPHPINIQYPAWPPPLARSQPKLRAVRHLHHDSRPAIQKLC